MSEKLALIILALVVTVSGCVNQETNNQENKVPTETHDLGSYTVQNVSHTDCETFQNYEDGQLIENERCGLRFDITLYSDNTGFQENRCFVLDREELYQIENFEYEEEEWEHYDITAVTKGNETETIWYEVGNYRLEHWDLDFPCGNVHQDIQWRSN